MKDAFWCFSFTGRQLDHRLNSHTSEKEGAWAEHRDRRLSPLNLSSLIGNKTCPTHRKLFKRQAEQSGHENLHGSFNTLQICSLVDWHSLKPVGQGRAGELEMTVLSRGMISEVLSVLSFQHSFLSHSCQTKKGCLICFICQSSCQNGPGHRHMPYQHYKQIHGFLPRMEMGWNRGFPGVEPGLQNSHTATIKFPFS